MNDSVRDTTAAALTRVLRDAALDDPWTDRVGASTRTRYAPDGVLYEAARLRLHRELIEAHRSSLDDADQDGALAVVVTAGPPGSGKTTALSRMDELAGYRAIDADDFKDPLLERAAADGLLDAWTTRTLPDGRPVQAREVSGFVHAESTAIADALRRRSARNGENVVVHGTLSSVDYIDDLLGELDESGYERLRIVAVEVPVETAVEQALARWWRVRDDGSDALGGRFVPEQAIRRYWPTGSAESVCSRNAVVLGERAEALGWDVTLDRV